MTRPTTSTPLPAPASARPEAVRLPDRLQRLEDESIHIIREVMAQFNNPVMLYSTGKDSSVMPHLARKAFHPGPVPFPLLHIDTTWKFFRDDRLPGPDGRRERLHPARRLAATVTPDPDRAPVGEAAGTADIRVEPRHRGGRTSRGPDVVEPGRQPMWAATQVLGEVLERIRPPACGTQDAEH